MEGKRLIKSLRLRNLLSYGSESPEVTLGPLNVLIGRNASGKSNFVEAFGLLRATPSDLATPIRRGGGISEWLWKGKREFPETEIQALIDYPDGIMPLRYSIEFTMVGQRMEIAGEHIGGGFTGPDYKIHSFFWRGSKADTNSRSLPVQFWMAWPRQTDEQRIGSSEGRPERLLDAVNFVQDQSILSQLKDPFQYPEITYLGNSFAEIRLFRELDLGPRAPTRLPQKTDLPGDFLLEDASNLALVLNDFEHKIHPKRQLIEKLKVFYDAIENITTNIEGGTVQIFIHEKGLTRPIPATRMSDGMLRYLCLLVILLHPTPPPLLCVEEPELGLHPDILPTIAELLIEASERTQIIVTTHSDALVSALSEVPESVLVCERDDGGTHMSRLEPARLTEWLEKYSLGELWRMGEIGGTRW